MASRIVSSFFALLCVLTGAVPALAASYPEQNIMIIVPFPPGGASDTTARLTGAKLSERLGKPVIVENRAGANGAIGATIVKQAKPDGYTLLVGSIGVFAINPALYKNLRYNPLKDFDLLSVIVRTPNVLVTRPDFPANSVAELIAYLKKNPNKVTFASSGVGSSDHLTAALFWQKTGTSGIHVPYKGGAPAISDLLGGHADVSFQNLGAVEQQIKAGKLKALAVTSDARVPDLPNVPTIGEAGIKDLVVYSWQAAAAPKGLPADVRTKIESELIAAAKSPDVKKHFADLGFDVVATTGAQFMDFLRSETERWKAVVESGHITVE
jgi:tripartite-type tricarboxylate transporter receptor subunit TctC